MTPLAGDILAFWFGPTPHAARPEWFRKDPAFDAAIRARFGVVLDTALAGALDPDLGELQDKDAIASDDPSEKAHVALARVVLLDQFTRNAYRDTPRAFAGDRAALATAIDIVDAGLDLGLDRFERNFMYLPFEHAEDVAMQQRSLALFSRLAADTNDGDALMWAEKHAAIVRRFGRYPHRNAILGRASTPEEIAFLSEPGSSF